MFESAVLSPVHNFRGLKIQWVTRTYSDGATDFCVRIGLDDFASPWGTPSPISKKAMEQAPDLAHQMPSTFACLDAEQLLKQATPEEILKNPPSHWARVDWTQYIPPEQEADAPVNV